MKIEAQIATVSLIISTLAFVVAISCALFLPEHIQCDYPTNLEMDNANQTTPT